MKDGKFNGGNPAYPVATNDSIYAGLTKRELFAVMAMRSFIASGKSCYPHDTYAEAAVLHADALLAELEKTK